MVGADNISFSGEQPTVIVVDGTRVDERLASIPGVLSEDRILSIYEVARRNDVRLAPQNRR
ncbi:hypothetical protein [Streptomyces caatingaensis]|uniref:hypothetical protein n=1 Tax=Streptomyces caatingaensis TaxID=1678637 RepID=UPI0006728802|nr:hypothetical protein [Streptomyces caatingaensis]